MVLRTADFDYALPADLIAQRPATHRDESRLLVVDRATGRIEHRRFRDIVDLLRPGDALALNTSKVVRARLLGTRDSGAPGEVFLLKDLGGGRFEAMVSPGGKLRPGRVLHVAPGFDVEILELTDRRTRIVRLVTDEPPEAAIERHGHIPLPPYIARADETDDARRYQTVYAREPGSVAAPTAGLHFTPQLLAAIEARGIVRADVLLHVGAGTFKPIEAEDASAHVMHEESYEISATTAQTLNAARGRGGAIWAVGTTTVRTLETVVDADGRFRPAHGETRIFIRPPHPFRGVDKLITNFHLPRSTLLMLVAAFAGLDLTRRAYQEAVRERYRFYSYGDAMVVL